MRAIRRFNVFVAMSGGVDSSVAAALLKERGFSVVGIHIKMWQPEARERGTGNREQYGGVCRQQYQDRMDAMRVAARLGIPFRTWDVSEAYRAAVVDYLVREYANGRTPNPDVMCNRHIKFGVFLKQALAAGADYVATGHYARLSSTNNESGANTRIPEFGNSGKIRYSLMAGVDPNKDQSYFLWALGQEELRRTLFPIGEFTKPEVRAMARKFGLPTAEKPDSQGICFIGELDVREFLKQRIPAECGKVLAASGAIIGEHEGAAFYTIGQRHGLGVGGGIPYYVAEKNMAANTLTVAQGPYDECLFRRELVAADARWVAGTPPTFPLRCEARIRYRQSVQGCIVNKSSVAGHWSNGSMTNGSLLVRFDEPQRAVTPGQSAVFYRGDTLLGGAVIA